MNNAIKLTLTEAVKSEDCMSHLFGSPILPESLQAAVSELDGDVMFFGQLDLAEVAKQDTESRLPGKGILYLFLDTAAYPYGAIVMHSTEEPRYVLEDFNSEVTGFEAFTVPYAITFEAAEEDADGTKLFGTPSWEQRKEGELFLQFDPLDNNTGFLSDVDGYAFFLFGDEARTPEKIRFVIDRS